MGLGDWFGKGRLARRARERELAHDADGAVALYLRAEQPIEASRVKLALADAQRDPSRKLLEYAHAIELAPEGSEARRVARARRANYLLALHGGSALAGAARLELERAAAELIEVDEGRAAAKAYRLLGDRAGEARALEAAGAVEELEFLFAEDDLQRKSQQTRERTLAEIRTLQECGRRREALARLTSLLHDTPGDPRMSELAASLRTRRVSGPAVDLQLGAAKTRLIFGREVILGRSDAALIVAHSAVSRRHLAFRRKDDGSLWVRDLDSRNGTQRANLPLAGELPLTGPLSLTLGREVPIELAPLFSEGSALPLLDVRVAGVHATLVLGDQVPLQRGWSIAIAQDWLELTTPADAPAYLDGLQLSSPTTLLTGDRLHYERDGDVALVL